MLWTYLLPMHFQIDFLLLDFSKAFDTVPHKRLYYPSYRIMELVVLSMHEQVATYMFGLLKGHAQKVASEKMKVISGVPQGTVLGPL